MMDGVRHFYFYGKDWLSSGEVGGDGTPNVTDGNKPY